MSRLALAVVVINAPVLLALTAFCAEIIAGLPVRRNRHSHAHAPAYAVLMPAHNEAKVIAATVDLTLAAMRPGDRLLVVADNCDDETAAIARAGGAEVSERHDPERRGKGYALAHGIELLAKEPAPCVIVLDADCRPQPAALERLAARACESGRPVQACYLLEGDDSSGPVARFSTFAFMLKNRVRQQGISRLGGTCVLTGSGMAFPWPVIAGARLADGETVEDLVLGLRLALDGHAPLFEPSALILSDAAPNDGAAEVQRGRWERGFVAAALRFSPRLLASALRNGSRGQGWLALHLLVPPFVLLFVGALLVCGLDIVLAWLGVLPASVVWAMVGACAGSIACVGLSWLVHGRSYLSFRDILALRHYIAAKARIWSARSLARPATWDRTER